MTILVLIRKLHIGIVTTSTSDFSPINITQEEGSPRRTGQADSTHANTSEITYGHKLQAVSPDGMRAVQQSSSPSERGDPGLT